MGAELYIFQLYMIAGKPVIFRVEQPGYSNVDQGDEDRAVDIGMKRAHDILQQYLEKNGLEKKDARFIGELQGTPEGDVFYEENRVVIPEVWYAKHGEQYMYVSVANSEEKFWNIVEEDNMYSVEGLQKPAFKLTDVQFIPA